MSTLSCKDLVAFLDDYIDGSQASALRGTFETHLHRCPSCRDYVQTYRDTIRMTRCLCADTGGEIPAEVPEELVRAIIAARKAACDEHDDGE